MPQEDETSTERLSFRTTKSNWQRLIDAAKSLGMLGSNGRPNISAVLNYMIDRFDFSSSRGGRGDGQE
jgi:hypothetical protein